MAKGLFFGVLDKAKKVKKKYYGVGDKARKVKKVYFGVDGKARLAWISSVPAGQVVFTSSQVWTVPDGVKVIDIFCVGGGSGTAGEWNMSGGGGGGGYTETYFNTVVSSNQQIAVVVGAGGMGNTDGGSSSFRDLSAFGGKAGSGAATSYPKPGYGGSGGGGSVQYKGKAGHGGSNGSSGTLPTDTGSYTPTPPGTGQGRTTRAFGEDSISNTLYSGGGGGYGLATSPYEVIQNGLGGAGGGGKGAFRGFINGNFVETFAEDGYPNTGGGAGAVSTNGKSNGGSGIVIIRWAEQ